MAGKDWEITGRTDWCKDPARRNKTIVDITGQVFGDVRVVSLIAHRIKRGENARYICQCVCGKVWQVYGSNLRRGLITSCGCRRILRQTKPSGHAAFVAVLDMIRRGASRRRLAFDLSEDEVKGLTQGACAYCGISPSKTKEKLSGTYIWNGIDRVNPKLPYTKENCVSCCEMCNRMKRTYGLDEFLAHIHKIATYQQIIDNAKPPKP